MSDLSFVVNPVIGHPSDLVWSQFWENQASDPELGSQRGRLFGLITIQKEAPDQDISTVGKELISFFNETYFTKTSDSPFDHLKLTLQKVGEEHPVFVEGDLKTSLLVAVHYQKFVYLGAYGSGAIKLIRSGQSATLLEASQTKPLLVSGQLQPQDRFLLLSSSFLKNFSWEDHQNKFIDPDPASIKETLSTLVYSQPDSSDLALIILDVKPSSQSVLDQTEETDPLSKPSPSLSRPLGDRPLDGPPSSGSKKLNLSFLKTLIAKKRLTPIRVHNYPIPALDRRRRISAILGIGFLLLLSVSVYFGNRKRQSTLTEEKYQNLYQQISDRLSTAQTLKNLNLEDALVVAKEAQDLFTDLESLNVHPEETSSLKTSLNTLLAQTGQEGTFSPDLLYDLSLIRSGIKVTSLALEDSLLYLLDSDAHLLDQLDVTKKSTKRLLDDTGLSSVSYLTASNNTLYLLKDDGLYKATSTSLEKLVDKDDSWDNLVDLASWEGKVYTLTKDMIYRYPLTASGLGERQDWLKGNLNLSNPVSLAINGRVWALSRSGAVKPYYLGQEDKYEQSVTGSIKDAAHLTTHPDLELVAFTDRQKDIYLFDKEGQSIAKYSTNLTILDLILDATNSRLLILGNDQKLYQITLN
jgi:hypothetical protein